MVAKKHIHSKTGGKGTLYFYAQELLKAAAASPLRDRFRLHDLFPTKCSFYVQALENLTTAGHLESIKGEKCGEWFHRLTSAGLKAAEKGQIDCMTGTGRGKQSIPIVWSIDGSPPCELTDEL